MIRKGLLDITILGSLQVSENGDLANWIVPGSVFQVLGSDGFSTKSKACRCCNESC